MSGFFGVIRADGTAVEQEFLNRMARALEFRGPDGVCTWKRKNAGFSFTFLNTGTPHQTQRQPVGLDDRHWLTGEVRLDARKELVIALSEKGEPVDEDSADADLLLHAWKVWGEASLLKIRGDLSFSLWDAQSETLICARDLAGARPFYYAQGPGIFCFSNTLQILQSVPGISGQLDELFVRDFLLEGLCRDSECTVWRSARRLLPGHRLQFTKNKLDVRRFQQLPIEEPLRYAQPEQYLENFRDVLGRAVASRLPQGKTALYLSGGLDSASVCAMAANMSPVGGLSRELKAFTVSWRTLMDDPEPEFAIRTAAHLGLAHEILEEAQFLPNQQQMDAPPEPSAEHLLGRANRLYRCLAAYSRVVLSGDGGDNILDGQSWPYLKYLWSRGDWREIARSFGGYSATHGKLPALHGGFRTRLRGWFHRAGKPEEAPPWLNEELSKRAESLWDRRRESVESLPEHPTHPQAYRGLHSGYWGSVLEEEDAGWTGVLLETRAPFLDLRVLEFLLRLPPVPWCIHKELTRQAMGNLLPVEILERPKTPLVEDPLRICQQKGGWHPEVPKNPPKRSQEFVEWNSWLATLENSKGLFSWENLYPLALADWFKAIENNEGIQ